MEILMGPGNIATLYTFTDSLNICISGVQALAQDFL